MTLYIIGYLVMWASTGAVIYGQERSLRVSILCGLIWPWLLLSSTIEKILTS